MLQNQCLLPTVLSQCPTPVLPLPHTEESPGTIPAKHRAPACFPQAPWSFTVSCRLHVLSPPHPSGKGRGPPAPPGAPAGTGTEASTDLTPRKVQPCTFLLPQGLSPHLSHCPGSYQLLLLAWDPQVQPHARLGQLQHCVTCSITPLHKEHNSRCLFTLRAFYQRPAALKAGGVSVGVVQPGPGLGLSEHEVCACVLYLGVFL